MINVSTLVFSVLVCTAATSHPCKPSGKSLDGCIGHFDESVDDAKDTCIMIQTSQTTSESETVSVAEAVTVNTAESWTTSTVMNGAPANVLGSAEGNDSDRLPSMAFEHAQTKALAPSLQGWFSRHGFYARIKSFHMFLGQPMEHVYTMVRRFVQRLWGAVVEQPASGISISIFLLTGLLIGAIVMTVVIQVCPVFAPHSNALYTDRGVDLGVQDPSVSATGLDSTLDVAVDCTVDAKPPSQVPAVGERSPRVE